MAPGAEATPAAISVVAVVVVEVEGGGTTAGIAGAIETATFEIAGNHPFEMSVVASANVPTGAIVIETAEDFEDGGRPHGVGPPWDGISEMLENRGTQENLL